MGEGSGIISRLVKKDPVKEDRPSCVKNWDDVEKVWHHLFYNELRAAPEDHPTIITVKPLAARADLEKTVQMMFETFSVPSLLLFPQDLLAVMSSGRVSAVVVDSGLGSTTVSAVYEMSRPPGECILSNCVAGAALTSTLQLLMEKRYPAMGSDFKPAITDDLKHKLGYVALNYLEELREKTLYPIEKMYQMPDGNEILLNTERFMCCEALFNPQIIGYEEKGIPDLIIECLGNIKDSMIREEMMSCPVVCVGGSTMFPGFSDRLTAELTERGVDLKVICSPERKCSTWIGGSILSDLKEFQSLYITKEEYDETGPTIVHSKML